MLSPTDMNGKALVIGQRVRVFMSIHRNRLYGSVTEVNVGHSCFITDGGVPCQRPNEDFEIIV